MNMHEYKSIKMPEQSKWKCYLFGCGLDGHGLIYHPIRGKEPNAFVRWMMKICFDCMWVKEKTND